MSGVKNGEAPRVVRAALHIGGLSRLAIDALSDGIALCLGERGQGGALRQVLANQAVGVLVGTALPGVVGRGEVELETSLSLNGCVAVELGSVVGSDGLDERACFRSNRRIIRSTRLLSAAAERFGNFPIRTTPVRRSTRVTTESRPEPWTVSISQCPNSRRSFAAAGRSEMCLLPETRPRRSLVAYRFRRRLVCCRRQRYRWPPARLSAQMYW